MAGPATSPTLMDMFIRQRRAIPRQLRADGHTDHRGRKLIGAPRTLQPGEIDNLPILFEFYCEIFDIGNEQDRQRYIDVYKKILNRRYVLQRKLDLVDNEKRSLRIYLEWIEPCTVIPDADHGQPNVTNNAAESSAELHQRAVAGAANK